MAATIPSASLLGVPFSNVSDADLAGYVCPHCGNGIPYFQVAARRLGDADHHHTQVYVTAEPYCQCTGFPGVLMVLRPPFRRDD